ncbi:hypothetical protein HZB01_01735 [Candidatus Woesearchaeota archaeon]|nr:hypothetical protein [Candidatus Woesearchaeota archaeon]
MAENDIYNNEKKYFTFRDTIESYCKPPELQERKRKYWIKHQGNVEHFRLLFRKLEARDTSYIHRLRLSRILLIVTHILDKDLAKATREDIDKTMVFAHTVNKTVSSKQKFVRDVRFLWKLLFPEMDEKGRIDEGLTPYAVRHLSAKIDKSKQKLRGDKFSLSEFEQLVQSFADDPRMQAIITIALESLGRPQELLHRRIKDVELHDNYGKIYISSHGKEGTGFLRIMDSYFYLSQWLNKHPFKQNPALY